MMNITFNGKESAQYIRSLITGPFVGVSILQSRPHALYYTHNIKSITLTDITHSTAPTAPPGSLRYTEVTSTSVTLSWIPPPSDQHNGIIRYYVVKVTEQHTGMNSTYISTYTSFTVLNLHPFYIYHFTVSAYTVAPGPHTDVYTVQTLEERKLTVVQDGSRWTCSHVIYSTIATPFLLVT